MNPRGGRTTPGTPAAARKHWQKALELSVGARQNLDGGSWSGAFSNAILSLIQASSAICIHYLGFRSSGPDHGEAAAIVSSIERMDAAFRDRFVAHFRELLAAKSLIQYSAGPCTEQDARDAVKHVDRALASLLPVASANGWARLP